MQNDYTRIPVLYLQKPVFLRSSPPGGVISRFPAAVGFVSALEEVDGHPETLKKVEKQMNEENPNVNYRTIVSLIALIFVLILCGPWQAQAQVTTAAVRGTVSDEQGAILSGAQVTITNTDTNQSRSVATDSDGSYNFPDLPLGGYKINYSHQGFKTESQTGIVLHVNDSRVFNVSLKIGAITEEVVVQGTLVQVETTNAGLSGLVEGKQVTELPLNGRNFMQLVTLVPGVATGEGFSAQAKGLKGGSDISISGGAVNGNLWLVDGAHNNDVGSNRTVLVFPSIDAIDEFKIERNSYSAQYGQSAGGQISVITKHGTDLFHGSAYYFGRNDALNANDAFVGHQVLRRNDFGYTFGGPIIKNKAFFFWSEEWNRMTEGAGTAQRVPTVANKGGDFRDIAACPGGFPGFPSGGLQDPANGDAPFPTPNMIPTDRLSPAAQVVLLAYPDPTNPDPCAGNNFVKSFGVPTTWREENIRGDINITKSLAAMMRFTNDSWQLGPPDGGFGWGNNNLGEIGQSWAQPGRVAIGKLTKTIGSTAVNDFTFSYSANRITITPAGNNPGLNQQLNDTIPTFFPLANKTFGDKGPSAWINCCGLPSVWTIAPWQNQQDLYTWQDDFSMVKGKHTLKFGGLYSTNYKTELAASGEFGTLGGAVGYNGFPGAANLTGYGIADLELQNMAMGWSEADHIFTVKNVWHDIEFYAVDNWRVTPRLTLDLGLRWSFLPPPYLSNDQYTLFNPVAFDASLGNTPCNGLVYSPGLKSNPCPAGTGGMAGPTRALMNRNNHTIAPRVGFAYDPLGNGKWAIRVGAGQYFNRDRLWPLQLAGANPPFDPNFNSPGGNGRFLDNTNQLPACDPNCFGTGLGSVQAGQSFSNNVPNSWQWNVSVQHELLKDTRLEVAYVGHKNLHWETVLDANGVPEANRLRYAQLENSQVPADVTERLALRPFSAAVGDNAIKFYDHTSSSNYQALQTLFNMRRGPSTLQVAYTFSKLLSNSQQIDSPPVNVDAYNVHASWGPDILNKPHLFSANLVYQFPSLTGSNALLRNAAGGWQANTIVNISSGPSISVQMNEINGLADPSGVGKGGNAGKGVEFPNRIGNKPCNSGLNDPRAFINPNLFTLNGFQLGQLGNAGIGICSGPPIRNVDFGVNKTFKIGERVSAQFRFEFFNLFNHPIYNAQNVIDNNKINFTNVVFGDAAGNVVTDQRLATQILSADPNNGTNFGRTQTTRENGFRQIQYAFKIVF